MSCSCFARARMRTNGQRSLGLREIERLKAQREEERKELDRLRQNEIDRQEQMRRERQVVVRACMSTLSALHWI